MELYIHVYGSRRESSSYENERKRMLEQHMRENCYIGQNIIKNRVGKSAPDTKELAEFILEAPETFPFLLGNLGRGRIVLLLEVRVNFRWVKIIVWDSRSRPRGNPRSRPWPVGRFRRGWGRVVTLIEVRVKVRRMEAVM